MEKSEVRKWNEKYLEFGFTFIVDTDAKLQKPMCMICGKVYSNSFFSLTKIQNHFTDHTLESNYKSLTLEELKKLHQQSEEIEGVQDMPHLQTKICSFLSFELAYLISKAGLPRGVGEKVVKPFLQKMVQHFIDEDISFSNKELLDFCNDIPMSSTTIARRIHVIENDLKDQMLHGLNDSNIGHSLQIDESCDISGMAQLISFVSYEENEQIVTELLSLNELKTHTTADAQFGIIDDLYSTNKISFDQLINIATDGCNTMMGAKNGVVIKLKKVAPNSTARHCILHKYSIALKYIPPQMKAALTNSTAAIKYIKRYALNARLLAEKCQEQDVKHDRLLHYNDVRWLSLGESQGRFYELHSQVFQLICEKAEDTRAKSRKKAKLIKEKLEDPDFVIYVAYMADIFSLINEGCKGMQGKDVNIFTVHKTISKMKERLIDRLQCIQTECITEEFSNLYDHINSYDVDLSDDILSEFEIHLLKTIEALNETFPEKELEPIMYILKPFETSVDTLPVELREEFGNFKSKRGLRTKFKYSASEYSFWVDMQEEFPKLSLFARRTLSAPVTSYRCEQGFSIMNGLKTKPRNRLEVSADLRIKVSTYTPRFESIVDKMQQHHVSH